MCTKYIGIRARYEEGTVYRQTALYRKPHTASRIPV